MSSGFRFELTLHLRDHLGNPTGSLKNFATDNAYELADFWQQNTHKKMKQVQEKDADGNIIQKPKKKKEKTSKETTFEKFVEKKKKYKSEE